MKLAEQEAKAIKKAQVGQTVCLWRTEEPEVHTGRAYRGGGVAITVVELKLLAPSSIAIKDIKRSGWIDYGELLDWLRETGGGGLLREVWQIRCIPGDVVDRPRLLRPAGGTSSSTDYTTDPSRAMRGEPEALTDEQMSLIQWQSEAEREQLVREFQERVASEARTLFRGEDALRNFERVLGSLGQPRENGKKRRNATG